MSPAEQFAETHQDHHHIFPKDYLKTKGIDSKAVDSIVNKTLISSKANKFIGNNAPSDYLTRLLKPSAHGGAAQQDAILLSHAINPAHLRNDDWDGFVRDRRARLQKLIEEATGSKTQKFTNEGRRKSIMR